MPFSGHSAEKYRKEEFAFTHDRIRKNLLRIFEENPSDKEGLSVKLRINHCIGFDALVCTPELGTTILALASFEPLFSMKKSIRERFKNPFLVPEDKIYTKFVNQLKLPFVSNSLALNPFRVEESFVSHPFNGKMNIEYGYYMPVLITGLDPDTVDTVIENSGAQVIRNSRGNNIPDFMLGTTEI